MRRAVFLDRDGVLNQLAMNPNTGEYESPHASEEVEMLPGAVEAAKRLQDAGFSIFVVSNQPSAAKGKLPLDDLKAVIAYIESNLTAGGVHILRGYYCHHHPEGIVKALSGPCGCRKPAPGSLLAARDEFGIDLSASWMIGDQESDVQCGQNAGCRTVLVANPLSAPRRPGKVAPTIHARDLQDGAELLLRTEGLA